MRNLLAGFALALSVCAQDSPSIKWDPIADARKEVERLRELVEHGVAPRNKLEMAEQKLAEAQDDEVLKKTLYGKVDVDQLTPEQSADMVEAAQRQVDRQTAKLAIQQKLVDEGVKARLELTPYIEELDTRRRTLDLAKARAKLFEVLAELARLEAQHAEELAPDTHSDTRIATRFDGKGFVQPFEVQRVELDFAQRFGFALPVSARGETAVHRSLGFDHRGRVDVAVNPDQPEGVWLRRYLEKAAIPYFAFRAAIRGKATGAHIHIGPPSNRYVAAD